MLARLAGARLLVLLVLVLGLATGCATTASEPSPEVVALFWGNGKQDLTSGIKRYENGDYVSAQYFLKSALASGLRVYKDRVTAHKYLAFLYCSDGDIKLCHDEFAMALDIDGSFTLSPSEARHPVWGVVFDDLKSGSDEKSDAPRSN